MDKTLQASQRSSESLTFFGKSRRVFLAAGLALYAILHITFWAKHPPDVDPINFITALQNYDISVDSPHPPGYPLFVACGRMAALLVGSANAYQLVNLSLLLLSAGLLVRTFKKLRQPEVGLIAATLVLTHPFVVAASLVQESYVADAFCGIVVLASAVFVSNRSIVVRCFVIGAAFVAIGLFRVVSAGLLLPLCVAALLWLNPSAKFYSLVFPGMSAMLGTVIAFFVTVGVGGG